MSQYVVAESLKEGYSVERKDDEIAVSMIHPQPIGQTQAVVVKLIDRGVNAALRLQFDFARNGWSVQQSHDSSCNDPCWHEVAFIPSSERSDQIADSSAAPEQ